MLNKLRELEEVIESLLGEPNDWESLYIDYDYPHVERLYRDWGDYRINLHLIHPVPNGQSPLYHPHPWPSAMRILSRAYEMKVGHGDYQANEPPVTSTLVMSKGSAYEMIEMDAWHSVNPIDGNVASLMLTGKPWWDGWSPNDKEIALGPLTDERKAVILELFKSFY